MQIIEIIDDDLGKLAICAIRYCHGRQTYMPSLVQMICTKHIKDISDKDLRVMLDDCEFQERCGLYGNDLIDKPGWIVWKQQIEAEIERRKNEA